MVLYILKFCIFQGDTARISRQSDVATANIYHVLDKNATGTANSNQTNTGNWGSVVKTYSIRYWFVILCIAVAACVLLVVLFCVHISVWVRMAKRLNDVENEIRNLRAAAEIVPKAEEKNEATVDLTEVFIAMDDMNSTMKIRLGYFEMELQIMASHFRNVTHPWDEKYEAIRSELIEMDTRLRPLLNHTHHIMDGELCGGRNCAHCWPLTSIPSFQNITCASQPQH